MHVPNLMAFLHRQAKLDKEQDRLAKVREILVREYPDSAERFDLHTAADKDETPEMWIEKKFKFATEEEIAEIERLDTLFPENPKVFGRMGIIATDAESRGPQPAFSTDMFFDEFAETHGREDAIRLLGMMSSIDSETAKIVDDQFEAVKLEFIGRLPEDAPLEQVFEVDAEFTKVQDMVKKAREEN